MIRKRIDLIIVTTILSIMFYILHITQRKEIEDYKIANLSNHQEEIQDIHLRVTELADIIESNQKKTVSKNLSLNNKINSIDVALNSKSKRWTKIKQTRFIIKNFIIKKRYRKYMNIVDLTRYASAVVDFSAEYDVEIPLILAVTTQESAFNPKAISHAGAQGLMQLMPGTARECSSDIGKRYTNIYHIGTNVQFGTFYLRKMLTRFNDDIELAIKAYNAGPNYVAKVLAKEYRNYPEETKDYSIKVLKYLEEYRVQFN
ncbi:hypothetical protein CMI41_01270 [Candidatus Pacearchaeota archaeon]|nr:hypothetical protein [Candidatus Pacearchaeota archaeon]|tara:strand:- start:19106 stop:19882 length:777 start_codon:yes stop_codon:yes gene_type:complete